MNIGMLGKGNIEINSNLPFPKSLVFFFMSSNPRIYRRIRGFSPVSTPIIEIGRRKSILLTQESTLRRILFDSAISYFSPLPITFKMTSVGGASGNGGASSFQNLTSLVIGSLYSHQVPIQYANNPDKFIKKYGFFQFEEDGMYILP
jgi:hypothetical protein